MRRYLPLLFVVLVVLATALVFLLFRGPSAPGESVAPQPVAATAGLRELRVESEEEYEQALATLGTSSDEVESWARSRGFPPATYTSAPGPSLPRDYRREREARLRTLAEEGDLWAMQFLAARIAPDKPQEALDWYRKAVVHGSAYAAFKLGTTYHEVARWIAINRDDREEVLEIARREDPLAYSSLAWLLVAEYEAGLPPGAMSATLARFQAPDDGILASCERAAGFLEDIQAERVALGLTIERRRPPLAVELPPEETAGYCPPQVFPRTDFDGCEAIRLVGDVGAVVGHRCR